mgnify:CR=1 FL=1
MMKSEEVLNIISKRYPVEKLDDGPNAVATTYKVKNAKVGLISSMS